MITARLALSLLAVLLSLVATGCGREATPSKTTPSDALVGLPQRGVDLGSPQAPVVLEVWADPQCPFCRRFDLTVLPVLLERYVRPGRLRLRLHLLSDLGPDSAEGARAGIAASQQNRMWPLMHQLYLRQGPENSGWLGEQLPLATAAVPGLDAERLRQAMRSRQVERQRRQAKAQADRWQLLGTPAFQLYRHGQRPGAPVGPQRLEPRLFIQAIEATLRGRKRLSAPPSK